MIQLIFGLLWLCASGANYGNPAASVRSTHDDDDTASRTLEAAIMGLSKDLDSNATQQRKLAEAEDALLAQPLKLRKPQSRQPEKAQPMSQHLRVDAPKQYAPSKMAQYPPAAPVTAAPPVAATMAPVATAAPMATAAPVAPAVTVAPALAATDLHTWKMQMESKLHIGLSSEIKILNTLMAHQTQTHKQLLRFKHVLTVLGGKYKAQETLTQQQQAKIQSLEAQVAGLSNQVHTLNSRFSAYKQQYEGKWKGSETAIQHLYKKTADALGAMTAVHEGVQKELSSMTRVSGPAVPNATKAAASPAGMPPRYYP